MIANLFPEYEYIRVHKSGLVSLKAKRWSLKRTRINVTDLIIGEIPKRIADRAKRNNKGDDYLKVFNSYMGSMINISAYAKEFCIVDYVWEQYINLCLEVPNVSFVLEDYQLQPSTRNFIPLGSFDNSYWFGIIQLLRQKRLSYKGSVIVEKINEIKKKIPVIKNINITVNS